MKDDKNIDYEALSSYKPILWRPNNWINPYILGKDNTDNNQDYNSRASAYEQGADEMLREISFTVDDLAEGWITTYTGIQFYYTKARPEDISIEDIAHALSNTSRYAGHCSKFYSVAEHSVKVSQLVIKMSRYHDAQAGLVALLHDAAEAYMCDIPTPLKKALSLYLVIEKSIMSMVYEKFNLREKSHNISTTALTKLIDTNIRDFEVEALFTKPTGWPMLQTYDSHYVKIDCWSPNKAEKMFLKEFKILDERRKEFNACESFINTGITEHV